MRRWGIWAAVVVAVCAALVIGAQRPSHPTLDQRALSLAGQVRCPVCAGESAAQSQVPAAVAIRTQIRQELASGTSSAQVLTDLERAYGTSILERPQARGIGIVVWVLPIVVVAAAAAGLMLAFARWRRPPRQPVLSGGPGPSEDDRLVAEALAQQNQSAERDRSARRVRSASQDDEGRP